MTAEIVNLRQARKRKLRDLKETQSAENRMKYGRSHHQRLEEQRARILEEQRLAGRVRVAPESDAAE
jgi:Domain of unknown function (DUF4169)